MRKLLLTSFLSGILVSCKTTTTAVTQVQSPTPVIQDTEQVIQSNPSTLKRKVAIARFSNETLYGKGVFYSAENDPLSNKATDILSAKLAQSQKFLLLESANSELGNYGFDPQELIGVDYIILGSISEFGRKDETDSKVFSRTREQTALATVNVRLVDVKTGKVVYGEEGSGSSKAANKTSLGLGSTASYDSAINDQAIAAAISQLIDNIINKLTDAPWKSYVLSQESAESLIIAGGASQGIKTGDEFRVEENGKRVKNPQTGGMIALPGRTVARIQVVTVVPGKSPEDEVSICQIIEGSTNEKSIENLTIYAYEN